MKTSRGHQHGFTIVELLIVIVIIAILAAVTIVAYNGIQQRANNSAMLTAVSQVERLIKGYVAENGQYPRLEYGPNCATADNVCSGWSTNQVDSNNSQLMAKLSTIGTPPKSVPKGKYFGITYDYYPLDQARGDKPLILIYYLMGSDAQCGPGAERFDWTLGQADMIGCALGIEGPL